MSMIPYRGKKAYRSKGKSVARLAKGKTTAVRTLAKQVQSIKKQIRKQGTDLYYRYNFDGANLSADLNAINLCDFNNYTNCFGTANDDNTGNRIKHLSTRMDCYINMYNEYSNTQFTAYLVSLRDEIGSGFNTSSGALSLASDVHYSKVSTYSGLVQLNPRYFKVHRVKRFIVGNNGSAATVPTGERQSGKIDFRWTWSIRPGTTIVNPNGNWKDMRCTLDPSKNYYVLLFNDNSLLDSEFPQFTASMVHKMRTCD